MSVKFFLLLLSLNSVSAFSQNFANPVQRLNPAPVVVSPTLSIAEVEYESDLAYGSIDRTILGASAEMALSNESSLMGTFGLGLDGEVENSSNFDLKSGLYFGAGGKHFLHRERQLDINAYGMLNLTKEEFKNDVEVSTTELQAGATVLYQASTTLAPYASLELFLIRSGELSVGPFSFDFERDSLVNLRLGGIYTLDSFDIRGEIILLGEQTINISMMMPI